MEITKSESIKELATALALFQGKIEAVKKESVNPFFKSKYADLGSIIEVIRAPLASEGLSFCQFPVGADGLETILMHTSGEWMSGSASMIAKDTSPQAHGSMLTYLRRYTLSAILGIATEEDDDGNVASTPKPTAVKPHQKAKTPATPTKAIKSAPDVPEMVIEVGDDSGEERYSSPPNLDDDPLSTLQCHEGAEMITQAEYDWSMRIYGRPLCREHQKTATKK